MQGVVPSSWASCNKQNPQAATHLVLSNMQEAEVARADLIGNTELPDGSLQGTVPLNDVVVHLPIIRPSAVVKSLLDTRRSWGSPLQTTV